MKYAKTEAGQNAFKTRSAELTPKQRSAFILFDGKKSDQEVLAMTAGLGMTAADVEQLVALGFLTAVGHESSSRASADVAAVSEASGAIEDAPKPHLTSQERFARAWPIATQITAGLGLKGFRLNLAVEAAAGYEDLRDLLPKIRDAVGAEKAKPLEQALRET